MKCDGFCPLAAVMIKSFFGLVDISTDADSVSGPKEIIVELLVNDVASLLSGVTVKGYTGTAWVLLTKLPLSVTYSLFPFIIEASSPTVGYDVAFNFR